MKEGEVPGTHVDARNIIVVITISILSSCLLNYCTNLNRIEHDYVSYSVSHTTAHPNVSFRLIIPSFPIVIYLCMLKVKIKCCHRSSEAMHFAQVPCPAAFNNFVREQQKFW